MGAYAHPFTHLLNGPIVDYLLGPMSNPPRQERVNSGSNYELFRRVRLSSGYILFVSATDVVIQSCHPHPGYHHDEDIINAFTEGKFIHKLDFNISSGAEVCGGVF